MSHAILLIDDDQELCVLLGDFLGQEGFAVDAVHDGAAALARCRSTEYEALVLDVMLPQVQGLDVLRQLRDFTDVPVLMLTARGEDTDRIVGLEMGADDYLPKPCNPRELAARLRAILRRRDRPASGALLKVGATHLDSRSRRAQFAGKVLELTSAEFNILGVLLRGAGYVIDRETLCRDALGRPLTAYDRSVDVHVSSIRKKLAALGGQGLIKNIRGQGYQFVSSSDDE